MSLISGMFQIEPARKQNLKRAMWWALGIIFVLQLYFVRELLAAELLFGMLFAVLFTIGFVVYMIGQAGERGFSWAESGTRALAHSTRRGLGAVQEISRRTFRHLRSESAQ
jgi:hypothetical protein